jgi:hypothetical protein
MIKDDYILRMIEQMGDFFRKVMALENKGEFKASHDEIDTAMKQLGISRLLTRTMPANELVRLVRRPGGSNEDRCMLLSRLVAADAHVYISEGQKGVGHDLYTTSLGVLKETLEDADDDKKDQIQKEMDGIRFYITENIRENNDNLDV